MVSAKLWSAVPPPEDVIACQSAAFEWAESFDTKDWERLSNSIAPTLYVDYSSVLGKVFESLPADDFVAMASSPHFLGNKRIKTQHFIGAGKWERNGEDSIKGTHQMRVAHQKYQDDELKEVRYHGHAHGNATIHYRRGEDGAWKFAGLEPGIRWSEHDYDKIFQHEEDE